MIALNNLPSLVHSPSHSDPTTPSRALQLQPVSITPLAPEIPLADGRLALRVSLADRRDLQKLAQALHAAAEKLPEDSGPAQVSVALKENRVGIDPQSSFHSTQKLRQSSVSLEVFIQTKGSYMPTSKEDLRDLADALIAHSKAHPLGNFAGALSWPLPLSEQSQRTVLNEVACNESRLEGLPLSNPRAGALDYLSGAVSLSPDELHDPAKAMEKLLDTPRAQVLGEAIQRNLDSIPTDRSVNDYVLAAIHLGLDPESINHPVRNHVAGFNLAADTFWSKPPADVVTALAEHLKTRTSTPELGARLLLGRIAPQFLVKDIPASINIGSLAWANLCLAVARIEADSPGKAALMSFNDVMSTAQGKPQASDSVQKAVLIDWAIANQVLAKDTDESYSPQNIEYARTAFNQQQNDLISASELLDVPMPDRKKMALDLLKKTFGDGIDFEQKILRINYGPESIGARFSDPYSILDITMQGLKLNEDWTMFGASPLTINALIRFSNSAAFNIPATFDNAFETVTKQYKDIKQNLMMNAITQLPLEDRDRLNFGELRFFKENSYRRAWFPLVGDRLFHSSTTIRVQTQHNGKTQSYAFDTANGSIQKVPAHLEDRKNEYVSNEVTRFEEFSPDANCRFVERESWDKYGPNHFRNPRIRDVAATVVKGLEIDSDAVKRQAAGRTAAEHRVEALDTVGNFLLDLIPLKSAITHLQNGNYKDAAVDLAFDVFGLLSAGVGTATKLTNKAGSALSKLLRATRVIGADTLSALNPLAGVGDLATGAGKLALTGAQATKDGVQRVRGVFRQSDLASASSGFDNASIGVFEQRGKKLEVGAIQHNGKWYAVDEATLLPYGPPLEKFSPNDTLMPKSLVREHPRAVPYRRPGSDTSSTMEPLPQGDYVESTKGKLKWSHFAFEDKKQQTVQKFQSEMNAHYTGIDNKTKKLPERPGIPEYPSTINTDKLIKDALAKAPGIVFGESHSEMASFRLLLEKAPLLQEQGVKKVYLEGVIDFPGVGAVDDGLGLLGTTQQLRTGPTYSELVAKFKAHGIEVVPLDHYYLTRHKDQKLPPARTGHGSVRRLREFNYYASKVIQSDSGNDKWIALVGRSHMNTSEGVAGLAEQTGAIGVGVFSFKTPGGKSFGARFKTKVPDPNKPIQPGEHPGDLHILA
ncbi:hypothetical protein DYL59_12960 [Pseudomonas kairouanensis]|uniref:Type III effector HopAC1 n=1 Tax=Pseudomonas kairouanensis TaxID=2293832 RepID=A0A4Z0ARQ0_9PSED|nr:membrane-targeted effector domain-containing toxin [Pseudomonas kairouanensis]TFY89081.1 hypothetical protein DYL59_12960 [Pseudomonas kairouanensis]